MNNEKTITICGKEVGMLYCAAAETGFEDLSNKSSEIFSPVVLKRDADGNPIEVAKPEANEKDYIYLAIASIVAYYAKNGSEAPVKTEDILYDANSQEITNLIVTVIQLRKEWYKVPAVVKPEMEEKEGDKQEKNA